VLFGLDVLQPKPQHFSYLLDNHFRVFTGQAVIADPVGAMMEALTFLKKSCDLVLLHFDVDVVDSGQWPLENYPSYGGVEFSTIKMAVQTELADKAVVGLVVTEVNPNNDQTRVMLEELVEALVGGFSERMLLVEETDTTWLGRL